MSKLRDVIQKMTPGPWEFGRGFGIHTKTRRPDQCGCPDNHHGYQAFCVIENDSGVYPPCVPDGEGIVLLRNIASELADVVDAARNPDLEHPGDSHTGRGCDEWDAAYERLKQALRALDAKLEST